MFLAFKSKIIRKSEILIINLQKFELTIEILTKDLDKINITYSSTEEYSKDIKRVIEECSFKKDIDLFVKQLGTYSPEQIDAEKIKKTAEYA